MNKTLKIAITGLFVSYLSLPLPLPADSLHSPGAASSTHPLQLAETDSKSDGQAQKKAKEEEAPIKGFTLQHQVADEKSPPIQVKPNPLVLLQTFKEGLVERLKQHPKPLEVNSAINIIGSPELTKEIGTLPTLTVKTSIDAQGQGQSDLQVPEFQIKQGKDSLIWKGLTGQLKFTEQFDTFQTNLTFAEFTAEEKGKSSIAVSPFTLNAMLDADFFFNQMDFDLPAITFVEGKEEVKMTELTGNFNVEKTDSGLELGSGTFKVGQLGVTQKANAKFSLTGLAISGSGVEQDKLVNYTLRTQIDQLMVNDPAVGGKTDMSYAGNLELRRLDAEVVKELQKTMRNMQKQLQSGMSEEMLGIILLGKFMEVAPGAIAKSPELGLSGLNLKTPEGQLQGNLTLGLEGKKVTALNVEPLLDGLRGQAEFHISKPLLEKFLATQTKGGKSKSQKGESMVQQQIDSFLEQKWLVDAGDGNYQVTASLQDRKFILNGQEIPLPFLNSSAESAEEEPAEPKESRAKKQEKTEEE